MNLKNIVPWGRSFEEYQKMFSLNDADLEKNILGCGDKPSSINAELTARGGNVDSIDPVYQFDVASLKRRIAEVYNEVMPQMEASKDLYIWDSIPSVEALAQTRMDAMGRSISDYEKGKQLGRYINGSLPNLGFADNQFDLASIPTTYFFTASISA